MFPFDLDFLNFSKNSKDHLLPHPDRCLRPEADFCGDLCDEKSEVESGDVSSSSFQELIRVISNN